MVDAARWGWLVLSALAGCDASWRGAIYDYDVYLCRWQAVCAESAAGLDCEAYAAQLEVRPDPCVTYDAYYMDACLEQLADQEARLALGQASCQASPTVEAPACTQAIVRERGGACAAFVE